jgi:hypothetical protein
VPTEILALPIEERALIAFEVAVRKAIEEHAREGLPMYVFGATEKWCRYLPQSCSISFETNLLVGN